MVIRPLIILAYLVLVAPWPMFMVTGFWLFAVLGVVFAFVGCRLWPQAVEDWRWERDGYR